MPSLHQDYEAFIEQKVSSGEFATREAVIEAALDQLMIDQFLCDPHTAELVRQRGEAGSAGEAIELTEEYLQQKSHQMQEIIMRRFHERQQG
ncbi:hypothetical protein [Lacunimicrobium album]